MKVIVAGGRDFDDARMLNDVLCRLYWCCGTDSIDPDLQVVSGMAKGADMLGWEWAQRHLVHDEPVIEMPADWEKYGKAAGVIRNQDMSHIGDELVAFWDGRSTGTKNMIEKMVNAMKPAHIYFYKRKK